MIEAPAFAGHLVDRADYLRSNPAALAALVSSVGACSLALDGLSPVLDGQGALVRHNFDPEGPDAGESVFLGLVKQRPCFARVPGQVPPGAQRASRSLIEAICGLSVPELALFGGARSLVDWHARHRFCGVCGQSTTIAKAAGSGCAPIALRSISRGWTRLPSCWSSDRRRKARFSYWGGKPVSPPGVYSALAGFVEPGETIEEAVAREVFEEAGIRVRDVAYLASQPWPFPSQLMIGCHAIASDGALVIDHDELEDARWFTRDEVICALDGGADGGFIAPPRFAIAHMLLVRWVARDRAALP